MIGTTTTSPATPVTSALAAGLIGSGTMVSGVDVGMSRTFSYEGAAQIVVNDSDTKDTPAPAP